MAEVNNLRYAAMETDTQLPDSSSVNDDVNTAISDGFEQAAANNFVTASSQNSDNVAAKPQTGAPQTNNTQPKTVRNQNAVRRIQDTNKQLKSQIAAQDKELADLRKQISELQRSSDPIKQAQASDLINKAERILDKQETYQNIVSNGELEAWEQEAFSVFGDNAQQFLELSNKYGNYINEHEPALCEYIGTPHGMLLLAEWCTNMENPATRQVWLNTPTFKKQEILSTLYNKIEVLVKNGNQYSLTEKQQVAQRNNIPAPTGGKHSNGVPAADDLGEQINQAFKAFGY